MKNKIKENAAFVLFILTLVGMTKLVALYLEETLR